jgi:exocyst complex component 2
LDKIQSLYLDVIKTQFETTVSGRVDAKARRHYDALMEKCATMSRVGFAISHTYDVLRTRLGIQADFLGVLQQQCTRYSVNLRVHLEQALKSASRSPSEAVDVASATSAFFAEDARAVFECASAYWYNESLTPWMTKSGARDFNALVDSFYGVVCALIEHRRTVDGDALFAMRSVLQLDAEFREFCDARLGATDCRSPKRVALENELIQSARTLQATFIDEKLATLVDAARAWLFASSVDVDVCDECVDVMDRCRDIFDATDVVNLDISRVITHRLIDAARDEFTKALARLRPVAGRLRLEFEFVKLALDSRLTPLARDGADRLIELATRLCPDDDALLRARRLQESLRRRAELLRRLET